MATHRILFFAFSLSTLLSMALVDAGNSCVDKFTSCSSWKIPCSSMFMRKNCPNICDTCPLSGNCRYYEFLCASEETEDRCIPTSQTCDGTSNCRDGSDEHTTICGNCTSSQFACADGLQCIPARYKCDGGSPDCEDGSDEDLSICGCPSTEFACADGSKCVPRRYRCDGDKDCADGSDEIDENCGNCTSSEFACSDGRQCIKAAYECDGGRPDCRDGSDEGPSVCGQVEGLKIGGKPVGLWNYNNAGTLGGSSSRDKFILDEFRGRQFRGNGYVSIDHTPFYFNNERTTTFRLRFKTEKPTGLLFLTGNMTSNNFIALQLKDSILHYSYNLGGDTVTMFSPDPIHLNVWYMVEMKRIGKKGTLLVNGVEKDTAGTDDVSTTIPDNMGDFYVGGYPQPTHFAEVTETLFTGCVKHFMLGSDFLFSEIKEKRNVRTGCKEEVENQVSF